MGPSRPALHPATVFVPDGRAFTAKSGLQPPLAHLLSPRSVVAIARVKSTTPSPSGLGEKNTDFTAGAPGDGPPGVPRPTGVPGPFEPHIGSPATRCPGTA